jgi:hypothetical protein
VKLVRALIAAAVAIGAAVVVQMATSSGADASVNHQMCTSCWTVVQE